MAIITAAEFKTFRGITAATWDALIAILIDGAEYNAAKWCGHEPDGGDGGDAGGFGTATRTQYYDGNDAETIQLNCWPVTSITSVALLSDDLATTLQTYTAGTDYIIKNGVGQLMRTSSIHGRLGGYDEDGFRYRSATWCNSPRWPGGRRNIKVVYVGGYVTMPAGLKLAMYEYVDWLYGRSYATGGASGPFDSERLGEYSYDVGEGGETTAATNVATKRNAYPNTAKMQEWFGPFRGGHLL